jgi:hypothetical protein
MASANVMSGPKMLKSNTEPFVFIYLLDTTLQHLGFNVFPLNTEVVLKSDGSLNMLLI